MLSTKIPTEKCPFLLQREEEWEASFNNIDRLIDRERERERDRGVEREGERGEG